MKKEILASASTYKKKFYFNSKFNSLPDKIKLELQTIVVCVAEKIHGVFTIGFFEDGRLYFETAATENDFDFDDIGAGLEINKLSREEDELIRSLEKWYKYKFFNSK